MNNKILHKVIQSFIALTLIIAITLPSFVKLNHIFQDHEHVVCNDHSTTHLHQVDFDCDIYKYKVNNTFSFTVSAYHLFVSEIYQTKSNSIYLYLSEYNPLSYSLRGPPQLV